MADMSRTVQHSDQPSALRGAQPPTGPGHLPPASGGRRHGRWVWWLASAGALVLLLALGAALISPARPSPEAWTPLRGAAGDGGTWLSGASGAGVASGDFGEWRGRPVEIAGTWADDPEAAAEFAQLQPGGEYGAWTESIDVAVGAIGEDEDWQEAATGAYDERWRASLSQLSSLWEGRPGTVYIRFAHEMNGDWYPWSVSAGEEEDFIAAWKRYRALQQEVFPQAQLVFSVNRESTSDGLDWRDAFPGARYVDVMGVDYYNQFPYVDTVEEWRASIAQTDGHGAPKGLQRHLDFARSVGLPLSINEWSGHADNGDSPVFIEQMHDFVATNAGDGPGQLLYEIQYNVQGDDGRWQVYGEEARMPESAAAYQRAW